VTLRALVFWSLVAAALVFVPGASPATPPTVQCIDGTTGIETPCVPSQAYVELPSRSEMTPLAPLHDLAYAAADAGEYGCLWLLGGVVLLVLVRGLWSRGMRGALRRIFVVVTLGGPIGVGLLYASSFLDGRMIRLGPELGDWVPASLHVHTDRSTGLLSPKDVVLWHWKRGFGVLNISDRDSIRGGIDAVEFAREAKLDPPMLVIVGDEYHGRPDLVFVNVDRLHDPEAKATLAELADDVHAGGGALFVAHPWSKVPAALSLEEIFRSGVDGVEIVNNMIHGGNERIRAAVEAKKALLGVIDFKYGPHVNAITLIRAGDARTPEAVAKAIRERRTRVLHAVPGGARSKGEWDATSLGLLYAAHGLRTLFDVPRPRRAIWLVWALVVLAIWWLATRERAVGGEVSMGKGTARVILVASGLLELGLLAGLHYGVRGSVVALPVLALLAAAVVIAFPLLVASQVLARAERRA